jgi:hypothetical protein
VAFSRLEAEAALPAKAESTDRDSAWSGHGPKSPKSFASTLRAFASSSQYAFRAKSPISAASHVARKAKLALVKYERSPGINPAALKGGEMAAVETLAPMWSIAARDAATLIEPRESSGAVRAHCAPYPRLKTRI